MRITPADDTPVHEPRRPRRILIWSSDSHRLAVIFWVLSVAVVGVIAGLICTEFFAHYIAFLENLIRD